MKVIRNKGFSLIEVVLALAIAVFAIVPLIALLPAGMKNNQESEEISQAASLLNEITIALKQADQGSASPLGLSPLTSSSEKETSKTYFLNEAGVTTPNAQTARYQLRLEYRPIPSNAKRYGIHAQLSWPSPSSTQKKSSSVETYFYSPVP